MKITNMYCASAFSCSIMKFGIKMLSTIQRNTTQTNTVVVFMWSVSAKKWVLCISVPEFQTVHDKKVTGFWRFTLRSSRFIKISTTDKWYSREAHINEVEPSYKHKIFILKEDCPEHHKYVRRFKHIEFWSKPWNLH